jgi:hypothetical protein
MGDEEMKAVLLVTWLMSQHSPSSYQVDFESLDKVTLLAMHSSRKARTFAPTWTQSMFRFPRFV